uniref:CX domain-containing protein n=2 Tax=Dendroctonus ponderosae TaxID=77166 RepID=A0AAR5PSB0_DENPD
MLIPIRGSTRNKSLNVPALFCSRNGAPVSVSFFPVGMFLPLHPNQSAWNLPRFSAPPRVGDLKFCPLWGKRWAPNYTNVIKYPCFVQDVCCDEGCCAPRPAKYYDSWCFWMILLGIVLGCYLLCWYCKRVEKRRQRAGTPPQLRAASVDRLLETLILHYRRRQNGAPAPNVDQFKEAPPDYAAALGMPKPRNGADQEVPSYEQATSA